MALLQKSQSQQFTYSSVVITTLTASKSKNNLGGLHLVFISLVVPHTSKNSLTACVVDLQWLSTERDDAKPSSSFTLRCKMNDQIAPTARHIRSRTGSHTCIYKYMPYKYRGYVGMKTMFYQLDACSKLISSPASYVHAAVMPFDPELATRAPPPLLPLGHLQRHQVLLSSVPRC